MKKLMSLLLILAMPLRAEVIDLTEHTSLSGAYLVPQPSAEFVTVQMLLHVGEADFDGPEGLAHYLEHLVWYSADKAHGVGHKSRISNAWINTTFTNYWNASEPSELDKVFAASARIFAPLSVDPKFAREERDIVEREFDFRTADNAARLLRTQMYKALLPGHALSRSTIGTRKSLADLTPEMAAAFKAKWYWPNNAVLLISGPVTPNEIILLLKRHLSMLKQGALPEHPSKQPITWDNRAVSTSFTHPKVSDPFFAIHMKAPAPSGMPQMMRYRSAQMLRQLLNASTQSSPRTELYYNGFILSRIGVDVWFDKGGTINLLIEAAPEDGVPTQTALAETLAYFDNLGTVSKDEFSQISQAYIEQITREKSSPRVEREIAFRGMMEQGEPFDADTYVNALRDVTPSHLESLIKSFQANSISVTGVALPEE